MDKRLKDILTGGGPEPSYMQLRTWIDEAVQSRNQAWGERNAMERQRDELLAEVEELRLDNASLTRQHALMFEKVIECGRAMNQRDEYKQRLNEILGPKEYCDRCAELLYDFQLADDEHGMRICPDCRVTVVEQQRDDLLALVEQVE